MKKLITFLMLGILLLSFGFILSSEVHAQGDGPTVLPYLTFQSTSNFTLNVYDNTKHWNGTLYYSTDLETWHEWDGTTTLISSVNNKLYLRGTGNTKITGDNENYRWVLTGSNIECIGNIENLLDWEAVESGNHPSMTSYCYAHLFRDCTALTSAPALPATTLTNYCYSYMFRECTTLTSAPALPATTLTNNCYFYMFYGCTALTSAPALPATTLADRCYYSMFRECTALTSAPALPATTLAERCYYSMFRECTALKVSSVQIGAYQYEWRIPTSGAGIIANYWNTYMLSGTGGTFTGDPTIDITYYVENPPVYAMWGEKNKMTDITILIIGLIIFIIANILGFIYKNNLLIALSGLLWLLPIFLVDNTIIKIFSVIIMLITFLFSFKERDDYYYD